MKRFIVSAAALFFLFSCGKDAENGSCAATADRVGEVATRATLEADVEIVSSRLYSFDFSGTPLGSKASYGSSVELFLPCSTDTVMAFANFPELPERVPSLDSLLKIRTYLSYNDTDFFQMYGSVGVNVSESGFSFGVPLSRYAAKVTWSVSNNIDKSRFPVEDFKVKDVYLVNVAGENNLGLTGEPTDGGLWYNKLDFQSSIVDVLICSGPLYEIVPSGGTLKSSRPLYVFPNSYPDKSDAEWSARATRLVVRALLGTYEYYYPVAITPVEANGYYNVQITVNGPGNDTPLDPGKPTYMKVTVIDDMWSDGKAVFSEI